MIALFGLLFSMIRLDALNHGLRRHSLFTLALLAAVHFAGCGSPQTKDESSRQRGSTPNADEQPVQVGQVALGGEMKLDLSGAVALAVTDGTPAATTQAGTVNAKTALKLDGEDEVNLMKITADGQLLPAFAAKHKDVKIKNTWFRKNIVFVEFAESVLMETKESLEARKRREVIAGIYCNLGYATKEDPTVQCINPLKQASQGSNKNPVMVDDEGNVFYTGRRGGKDGVVIYNLKTHSELMIGEVSVSYKYVLSDKGDLFFRSGGGAEILGVLKKGASKPEKIVLDAASFNVVDLELFPDGLVYYRARRSDGIALIRINENYQSEDTGIFEKGTMGALSPCQGERQINTGSVVVGLAGSDCRDYNIIQYYPEYKTFKLQPFKNLTNGMKVKATAALNLNVPSGGLLYDHNGNDTLLISVEDEAGKPKLIVFNVLTGEESDAIPASLDLQVVNMAASGDEVYFSAYKASTSWGLADSKFIMGKIDLQANTVTTSNTPVSISSIEHL